MGGDHLEAEDAAVELVGAVGVGLEDVGDEVGVAALDGFGGGGAHQEGGDADVLALLGDHRETADLGQPVFGEEGLDVELRIDHRQLVLPVELACGIS